MLICSLKTCPKLLTLCPHKFWFTPLTETLCKVPSLWKDWFPWIWVFLCKVNYLCKVSLKAISLWLFIWRFLCVYFWMFIGISVWMFLGCVWIWMGSLWKFCVWISLGKFCWHMWNWGCIPWGCITWPMWQIVWCLWCYGVGGTWRSWGCEGVLGGWGKMFYFWGTCKWGPIGLCSEWRIFLCWIMGLFGRWWGMFILFIWCWGFSALFWGPRELLISKCTEPNILGSSCWMRVIYCLGAGYVCRTLSNPFCPPLT